MLHKAHASVITQGQFIQQLSNKLPLLLHGATVVLVLQELCCAPSMLQALPLCSTIPLCQSICCHRPEGRAQQPLLAPCNHKAPRTPEGRAGGAVRQLQPVLVRAMHLDMGSSFLCKTLGSTLAKTPG